jgi:hypothetical protein
MIPVYALVIVIVIVIIGASFILLWRSFANESHLHLHLVTDRRALEESVPATYFGNFNDRDLRARGCVSADQCKARYLGSIVSHKLGFMELRYLRKLVHRASSTLTAHPVYKTAFETFFGREPRWRICVLEDGAAEGNFPHTHGDIICLPRTFLSASRGRDDRVRTLIHELIHVQQRARPDLCHLLYKHYWHLEPSLPPSLDVTLASRRRSNPDLDDFVWINTRSRRGCIQVYDDTPKISLAGSRPMQVLLVSKDDHDKLALEDDTTSTCDYEHPNEAMAYLLSYIAVPSPIAPVSSQYPLSAVHAWLRALQPITVSPVLKTGHQGNSLNAAWNVSRLYT